MFALQGQGFAAVSSRPAGFSSCGNMKPPSIDPSLSILSLLPVVALVVFAWWTSRSSSAAESVVVRRAAFDIGSGATKLLVADIDVSSGAVVGAPLYEVEKPMPYKADAQGSASGLLSDGIQQRGLALLISLASKARQLGAVEANGVATEVFRTSPNGPQLLDEMSRRAGVHITTLTQEKEACLGLATAEVLSGGAQALDLAGFAAVWDSGGGSFQITGRVPFSVPHSLVAPIATVPLRTYTGKLGTGPAFEVLQVRVLSRFFDLFDTAINPVSTKQAEELVRLLVTELPPATPWLKGASVVAIGGWNSCFAVTRRAICLFVDECPEREGGISADGMTNSTGSDAGSIFTLAAARRALHAVTGRTDAQLLDVAGRGPEAEGANLVVSKLSLVVAVASHLGIERVRYVEAIAGNCAGLMTLGEFRPLRCCHPSGEQ